MELITTKSFTLATIQFGDPAAEKLMLCLPGRLDTKDYAHMVAHAEYFAEHGYFVVSFDPPGTWESPGDIALYTVENYLKAIDELIEHFGDRPTVTLGHSRGGTMSMMAGIRNPHITHFVAVMSHYGPSGRPDVAQDFQVSTRDLPPGTERTEERKEFKLPMSYFDDDTDYTGLETCEKPKLFFYGTEDVLVTPADVRETYDVAAEPKVIHELDSDHDYRLHPAVIAEVNQVVEKFLE